MTKIVFVWYSNKITHASFICFAIYDHFMHFVDEYTFIDAVADIDVFTQTRIYINFVNRTLNSMLAKETQY
jgi:hypothetical protein